MGAVARGLGHFQKARCVRIFRRVGIMGLCIGSVSEDQAENNSVRLSDFKSALLLQ